MTSETAPTILSVDKAWTGLAARLSADVPKLTREHARQSFAMLSLGRYDVVWPTVKTGERPAPGHDATVYSIRGIAYPRAVQ